MPSLPAMIERKSGAILNVASTAAFQPGPGMAVYFATKAFVLIVHRSAARGSEAARRERHRARAPARPRPSSARSPGGAATPLIDRLSAESADVVRAGLDGARPASGGRNPGLVNKFTAQGHRLLPRWLLRQIAGSINLNNLLALANSHLRIKCCSAIKLVPFGTSSPETFRPGGNARPFFCAVRIPH